MKWWTLILNRFRGHLSKSMSSPKRLLILVAALLTFALVIAGLETCQQICQTNQAINQAISRATAPKPPPTNREKSLQKTKDSLDKVRLFNNERIDTMQLHSLQSAIDSLFNRPRP